MSKHSDEVKEDQSELDKTVDKIKRYFKDAGSDIMRAYMEIEEAIDNVSLANGLNWDEKEPNDNECEIIRALKVINDQLMAHSRACDSLSRDI